MAPINLDIDAKFMNLIAAYTSSVRQRLQGLAGGMTWAARSQVNVIVIPVRIAGNWCLYQVVRGTHTQSVMRLTEAPMTTNNAGAMTALGEVDLLIHLLNRGAMRVWTRMLLRDAPAESFNLEEVRRKAQADATRDDYTTLEPVHLDTNRVTAGVACMYMLQQMLYSG
jgi:hypothetical protein